jgi:hypothetical protein
MRSLRRHDEGGAGAPAPRPGGARERPRDLLRGSRTRLHRGRPGGRSRASRGDSRGARVPRGSRRLVHRGVLPQVALLSAAERSPDRGDPRGDRELRTAARRACPPPDDAPARRRPRRQYDRPADGVSQVVGAPLLQRPRPAAARGRPGPAGHRLSPRRERARACPRRRPRLRRSALQPALVLLQLPRLGDPHALGRPRGLRGRLQARRLPGESERLQLEAAGAGGARGAPRVDSGALAPRVGLGRGLPRRRGARHAARGARPRGANRRRLETVRRRTDRDLQPLG